MTDIELYEEAVASDGFAQAQNSLFEESYQLLTEQNPGRSTPETSTPGLPALTLVDSSSVAGANLPQIQLFADTRQATPLTRPGGNVDNTLRSPEQPSARDLLLPPQDLRPRPASLQQDENWLQARMVDSTSLQGLTTFGAYAARDAERFFQGSSGNRQSREAAFAQLSGIAQASDGGQRERIVASLTSHLDSLPANQQEQCMQRLLEYCDRNPLPGFTDKLLAAICRKVTGCAAGDGTSAVLTRLNALINTNPPDPLACQLLGRISGGGLNDAQAATAATDSLASSAALRQNPAALDALLANITQAGRDRLLQLIGPSTTLGKLVLDKVVARLSSGEASESGQVLLTETISALAQHADSSTIAALDSAYRQGSHPVRENVSKAMLSILVSTRNPQLQEQILQSFKSSGYHHSCNPQLQQYLQAELNKPGLSHQRRDLLDSLLQGQDGAVAPLSLKERFDRAGIRLTSDAEADNRARDLSPFGDPQMLLANIVAFSNASPEVRRWLLSTHPPTLDGLNQANMGPPAPGDATTRLLEMTPTQLLREIAQGRVPQLRGNLGARLELLQGNLRQEAQHLNATLQQERNYRQSQLAGVGALANRPEPTARPLNDTAGPLALQAQRVNDLLASEQRIQQLEAQLGRIKFPLGSVQGALASRQHFNLTSQGLRQQADQLALSTAGQLEGHLPSYFVSEFQNNSPLRRIDTGSSGAVTPVNAEQAALTIRGFKNSNLPENHPLMEAQREQSVRCLLNQPGLSRVRDDAQRVMPQLIDMVSVFRGLSDASNPSPELIGYINQHAKESQKWFEPNGPLSELNPSHIQIVSDEIQRLRTLAAQTDATTAARLNAEATALEQVLRLRSPGPERQQMMQFFNSISNPGFSIKDVANGVIKAVIMTAAVSVAGSNPWFSVAALTAARELHGVIAKNFDWQTEAGPLTETLLGNKPLAQTLLLAGSNLLFDRLGYRPGVPNSTVTQRFNQGLATSLLPETLNQYAANNNIPLGVGHNFWSTVLQQGNATVNAAIPQALAR